jgi:hypothetical protein
LKIALATIAPDYRQQAMLKVVRSTWEHFARQYHYPILVVERPPYRDHIFWGKYFLLEQPDFADFDAILHLDNDVLINPAAPDIRGDWDPAKVGVIDEREQLSWDDSRVADYYAWYELETRSFATPIGIFNMGVFLMHRNHLPFFRELYACWLERTTQLRGPRNSRTNLKFIADQPHVSLALQASKIGQPLDSRFNRMWWCWYRERGGIPWWAFRLYTKSASILTRRLPPGAAKVLSGPGARALHEALVESHFLHIAGSKSPLWLWQESRIDSPQMPIGSR